MGINLGKMFADAAKGVSEFIDKTGKDITKAIDQNGDGKLDIADLTTISDRFQKSQAENRRKANLERLKPLFYEELEQSGFKLPKLIHIAEIDKEHADNEVYKGAIGYKTVNNGYTAYTLFDDHVDDLELSFYPEKDHGVYYVDPCNGTKYIALDQYFPYMKMQRVSELQRIAQALGAKHFRVTYREKNKASNASSVNASVGVKYAGEKAQMGATHSVEENSLSTISIEAENTFPGHAPIMPNPRYLKHEININNLINMRMNELSPLQHQHLIIELSNSSGLRIGDAVKVDGMLKCIGVALNTTVKSEAQNEERRILEYDIDF